MMQDQGPDVVDLGDAVQVTLCYPQIRRLKAVVVELEATRAADGIRISYDFDRDGWRIEQGSRFEWYEGDPAMGDPDWQEVAFVKAWAREVPLDA